MDTPIIKKSLKNKRVQHMTVCNGSHMVSGVWVWPLVPAYSLRTFCYRKLWRQHPCWHNKHILFIFICQDLKTIRHFSDRIADLALLNVFSHIPPSMLIACAFLTWMLKIPRFITLFINFVFVANFVLRTFLMITSSHIDVSILFSRIWG